jgi:GINS complex subunit 4
MDIDDILAAVDADADADTTRRLYGQGYRGPSDGELRARDLQELTRAWVAERSAPEVLVWPAELMARVGERVRRQVGSFSFLVRFGGAGKGIWP